MGCHTEMIEVRCFIFPNILAHSEEWESIYVRLDYTQYPVEEKKKARSFLLSLKVKEIVNTFFLCPFLFNIFCSLQGSCSMSATGLIDFWKANDRSKVKRWSSNFASVTPAILNLVLYFVWSNQPVEQSWSRKSCNIAQDCALHKLPLSFLIGSKWIMQIWFKVL